MLQCAPQRTVIGWDAESWFLERDQIEFLCKNELSLDLP